MTQTRGHDRSLKRRIHEINFVINILHPCVRLVARIRSLDHISLEEKGQKTQLSLNQRVETIHESQTIKSKSPVQYMAKTCNSIYAFLACLDSIKLLFYLW